MHQQRISKVTCFGEILWDLFPGKDKTAGGAPFNVGYHLHQMGVEVHMISAVGQDALGDELLKKLDSWAMPSKGIQRNDDFPTSTVVATIDDDNEAHYEIKEGVAWDHIQRLDTDVKLLGNTQAFVFGSLAARNRKSRETLFALLDNSSYRVFDVNLRPPYIDQELLLQLLKKSEVAKFNAAELQLVLSYLGKRYADQQDGVFYLQDYFDIPEIILSRGAAGAAYFCDREVYSLPAAKVTVNDTVGSGDSFLAGFLSAHLAGMNPEEALEQAICLSGFVTSKSGACPDYTQQDIEQMKEAYRVKS
ncbi:carbohydrate kinase [Sphingobacterium sp. lm-10]|uniref:carbohydrate kinase family protein n=1 Tax=Sphingobacterium sp. lm-10 TaxID=2944904 RepID=UPI0020219EA6|nr:carbohydrate kinase [Sphingobacterium sp. lm-10]MCL7987498.1 carbohydrate kinase [Sphingobacterium sp. lm-10]